MLLIEIVLNRIKIFPLKYDEVIKGTLYTSIKSKVGRQKKVQ